MTFHNLTQGSAEWLAFRRKKIGASDASTILNENPWSTPYQLWVEKITGQEKEDNEFMKHGRDNEAPARDLFEKMTGVVVSSAVASSTEREWQAASFDGIDFDHTVIVEIKCPKNSRDHEIAQQGKIPEKYIPQVQHQLAVSGLDMGYYFSYQNGQGAIVEVKRDNDYIKKLIDVERNFYFDHILSKEPPDLTEKDYEEKRDDTWDTLSFMYLQTNKKIKDLELEEKSLREQLIKQAQNRNCRGNGIIVSRSFPKGRVDYDAIPELKNVNMDIYRKPSKEQWRISVYG